MKVLKKYAKKTIISSWLYSYIIIIGVPTLLSVALLSYSLQYMQKEYELLGQSELDNLSSVMDGYFNEMRHIAMEFSMDPQVMSLANAAEHNTLEHYTYYEVQNKMSTYTSTNSNIKLMGILFLNHDTLLTNATSGSITNMGTQLLDPELLEFLYQKPFQNNYYYVPNLNSFTYIQSLPYSVHTVSNSYLFIILNPENWQTINDNNTNTIFQVHVSNSYPPITNLEKIDLQLEQESALESVSYSLIFQNSEIAEHLHFIQMIIIICNIICILVSIFLIYYFIKKHYMPLLLLVKKTAPDFRINYENEFDILEQHIDLINQENIILEKELVKAQSITEEICLIKLLQGAYSPEEYKQITSIDMWKHTDIDEKIDLAIIIIQLFDLYNEENYKLNLFIIKNICEELIGSDNCWQSVYINDNFLIIIRNSHDKLHQIHRSITTQLPSLLDKFDISIQIGISSDYVLLSQVHMLYKEAVNALEYCHLYDVPSAIYQEVFDMQTVSAQNTGLIIRAQHKFQNAVLTKDVDNAILLLPELFQVVFSGKQTISQIRLNIYSLINLYRSCILSLSEKNNLTGSFIDIQINSLLNCSSLDSLKKQFQNCLEELNTELENPFDSKQNQLINQIKEYIELHYSDNSLSAGQIANHFQMSLPTVSKLFKKHAQIGLLDYIHQVRIKHAKTLLQTQEYTINNVSSMVGYLSASTFIRIFKKYEGISPGSLSNYDKEN